MTEQEQYDHIKEQIEERRTKARNLMHEAYKKRAWATVEECRVIIASYDRDEANLRKPNT